MSNENKQPKEYDAVLGGNKSLDLDSAVLGGIASVKRRIATGNREEKIAALDDATWLYDEMGGLDLVVNALEDEDIEVQKAAYYLLKQSGNWEAIAAKNQTIEYKFFECILTIQAHLHGVDTIAINDEGKTIASCGDSTYIKIWSLETGEFIKTIEEEANSLATFLDFLIINNYGNVEIWYVGIEYLLRTIEAVDYSADCPDLVITSDGKYIIIGDLGYYITIWDFNTGKSVRSLKSFPVSSYYFTSLAISNNSEYIVFTARNINGIAIRNVKSKSQSYISTSDREIVRAIDKQNRFIVSSDRDNINIWDLKTKKLLQTIEAKTSDSNSIAINTDNEIIVTVDRNNIKIWDINTGKLLLTLKGHSKDVNCVAITNDGKNILSGSMDGTIKVWGIK